MNRSPRLSFDFLYMTVISPSSICSSAGTTVTLTASPSPAIAVGTYSYSWNVQGNATVLGTNSTLNVSPLAAASNIHLLCNFTASPTYIKSLI